MNRLAKFLQRSKKLLMCLIRLIWPANCFLAGVIVGILVVMWRLK